jgi:hypothetical protein
MLNRRPARQISQVQCAPSAVTDLVRIVAFATADMFHAVVERYRLIANPIEKRCWATKFVAGARPLSNDSTTPTVCPGSK